MSEGAPLPGESEPTAKGSWRFDDHAVDFAIRMVEAMGVLDPLAGWRQLERERLARHPGGAPETFPAKALWVAMVLAALHERPMLATTFRDILFVHISRAMRDGLGVPAPPDVTDQKAWLALHRCIRTRFWGLLQAIDPSPLPKNRRLSPREFEAAAAQHCERFELTDELLEERHDRLSWICNAILEASFSALPRSLRRRWRGSVGLDATAVPAFSRDEKRVRNRKLPRAKRRILEHAADPDAGLYVRTTDGDRERGAVVSPSGKRLRSGFWAYEASIVVTGNGQPALDPDFPSLVVGMAPLHRPSTGVAANAMTALSSIVGRSHPAAWLAADRAYTHALAEEFQLPARALGYDLVLDYRADQLGVQGSFAGALHIEGAHYCPAIPSGLQTATRDFRAHRIDEATWRARIEARRAYRLRPKAQPDAEGHIRMLCPAAGMAPTLRCEMKPVSLTSKSQATARTLPPSDLLTDPPKVCVQQSITMPPDANAKLHQGLHFGSPEWAALYGTLRNTIEGINGIAKDGAYSALADASRRRLRGVAAQSILVALLLFATNVRKIESFLIHSEPDEDGTPRKRRVRRRTTRPIETWRDPRSSAAGAAPP
jgi:hypothetical protein